MFDTVLPIVGLSEIDDDDDDECSLDLEDDEEIEDNEEVEHDEEIDDDDVSSIIISCDVIGEYILWII